MIEILIDAQVDEAALARLRSMPNLRIELVLPEEKVRLLPPELIRTAEILFCTFPPENFAEMRAVRFIQITSAGYSQLFDLDLVAKSVRAANSRGCFDVPIAEWNIAMMINLARNLRQMIRNQEKGVWDRAAAFQSEIRGSIVGIWGYGGIGRETARLARMMGMQVHALSRGGVHPSGDVYSVQGTGDAEASLPNRVFVPGQELEFLSALDFLVVAVPLTRKTEGMIGERELRALPGSAFLLNPARGPLIREDALLRALRENWIAGAAIDTHYHYPMPADHALWRFPNVIFTPHISGSSLSPHYRERIWEIFTTNVERYCAGKPLLNELSAAQLHGE